MGNKRQNRPENKQSLRISFYPQGGGFLGAELQAGDVAGGGSGIKYLSHKELAGITLGEDSGGFVEQKRMCHEGGERIYCM